jgi:hypothetical protein
VIVDIVSTHHGKAEAGTPNPPGNTPSRFSGVLVKQKEFYRKEAAERDSINAQLGVPNGTL